MDISARLDEAMREAGFESQSALSRAANVPQPTIARILKGPGRRGPESDTVARLAQACGVSFTWLNEGKGPKSARRTSEEPQPQSVFKDASAVEVMEDEDSLIVDVPLVRLHLRAGAMGYMADPEEGILSRIRLDRMWLEQKGLYPENLIAVRVKGDSMSPRIEEGDIVVVNIADRRPISGEVFAINHGGEPLIKRLHKAGNMWSMRSDNPHYKPEAFNPGESPIVGKVVYMQSTKV